ncbi:unnamed protein product [Moneuplotes crassus]|uniref:Uncharacterized protein n=1 Tax=Euplotes crassus TaxID=5936 RepID=A0AAD2D9U6_EUPCR|nr:unnamed protein product [Moneuplotes crassus]
MGLSCRIICTFLLNLKRRPCLVIQIIGRRITRESLFERGKGNEREDWQDYGEEEDDGLVINQDLICDERSGNLDLSNRKKLEKWFITKI